MCGRFTISKDKSEVIGFLNQHFSIDNIGTIDLPRYNIGPGQDILALIFDGDKYRAGTIPWDYKIEYKGKLKQIINARSESIDQKYSFKDSFKYKRCLIVSDGFYEWDKITKTPYRIVKTDGSLYFYAGIYKQYIEENQKKFGALIITTKANPLVEIHHERMPVILDPESAKEYLNPHTPIEEIKNILVPYSPEKMDLYEVSKDVNSMSNDNLLLIKKTTNN